VARTGHARRFTHGATDAGSATAEPPDELPVREDPIALRDRINRGTSDRGVPRRDREREETSSRLRNGDAQLGDLLGGSPRQ
jgi:hypothetical protein